MASTEKLNTHQKALGINLDPTSYGSFAEIGARKSRDGFWVLTEPPGRLLNPSQRTTRKSATICTDPVRVTFPKDASKPCWTANGPNSSTN